MTEAGDVVLLDKEDNGIAVVTLNRPDQRNAVNPAVAQRLEAIVKAVEIDPAINVVVLTGAGGKVFSSGADLKIAAAGRVDELMTADGGFAGFVYARRRKPWIAAVEGLALAGGCELALACDLIVASRDSAFGLPEVARGLIAAAGGLFRLPKAIPVNVAREIILTAGRLSAERAAAFGMVNRLTPSGEVLVQALALAGEIAANAPLAVQESLAIVARVGTRQDGELQRQSDMALDRLKRTDDLIEGATAFVEKRSPIWKGR